MQFIFYASEMSDSSKPRKELDLRLLGRRLIREGMPVQSVVAKEAGVSQSTVSRAIHGKIRTSSLGAQKLWAYVESRSDLLDTFSGSETVGPRMAPARKRAPRKARRRSDQPSREVRLSRDQLAKEAIAGLRDYLNDQFDPELVIQQLAVLRRAQDAQRP